MSDLDLMGSASLDISDTLGALDNISSGLDNIDSAAASAGASITNSMSDAASSFSELSNTASEAYSSIESGAASAAGAASNLGDAARDAGAGAKEASDGFSILDGITLGAGIAAVQGMTAAAQDLLATVQETVDLYGQLESASTSAAMRSGTATTTEDYLAASKDIQAKASELSSDLGVKATDMTKILSTYQNEVGGLANVTSKQLAPMEDLSSILGQNMADIYSSEKLLGKQFGTKDYSKISDIAAKAYAKTGIQVGDMGIAGTTLSSMNMSLERAFATVGTLQSTTGYGSNIIAQTLAKAESELMQSSAEREIKKNKKGEVTSDKMAYKGLGEDLAKAGLDVTQEKAKGLTGTLVDMYQKGIDFSTIFSGKQAVILEQYAAQQSQINSLTTELEHSQGAATTMGNAVDQTLTEKTEKATIAVENAKTAFGSLFEEPAKRWQDSVRSMANSTTEFINTFKTDGLQSAVEGMIDGATNYLENLDYEKIGEDLHDWLRGGWGIATGLFGSFLANDTELTGAFSAVKSILEPTFNDMFGTLQNAGIDAYNALGKGVYTVADAIGSTLVGAINTAIEGFATLIDIADDASGGKLGEMLKVGNSEVINGYTIKGNAAYNPSGSLAFSGGEGTSAEVWARNQKAVESNTGASSTNTEATSTNTASLNQLSAREQERLDFARKSDAASRSAESKASEIASNPSAQVSNLLSSGGKIDIGGTGASGWTWVSDLVSGNKSTIEERNAFSAGNAEAYEKRRQETMAQENQRSGLFQGFGIQDLAMTVAQAKSGAVGERVLAEANKQSEEDRKQGITLTSMQESNLKAGVVLETIHKTVGDGIDKLQEASDGNREETGKAGDSIRGLKLTWEPIADKWVDIQKTGEETKASTKEAADNTGKTSDGIREFVQWAKSQMGQGTGGTGTAAAPTYTPSMFYGATSTSPYVNAEGGYVGPTVNYPAYKNPILEEQAAAQAINQQYGIGTTGSISQDISINVNASQANSDLQGVKSTVDQLQSTDIGIKADVSEARRTVNEWVAEVNKLRPVVNVDVKILLDAAGVGEYIVNKVHEAVYNLA